MSKLINIFEKSIIWMTLTFFLVIGYNAILYNDISTYLNSVTSHSEYVYWLVSFVLLLLIIVIFKIIDKLTNRKRKILKYALISFLVIIQFIMLIDVSTVSMTDPYIVNDQARALAFGLEETLDYTSTTYFEAYSNNNFCVLLVILLTKFFSIFNLVNNTEYLVLFNIILIDLSIILVYKVAKILKGNAFALKSLVLSVLNPLNYLLIHWTYTNTYSLPFTIGCIYIVFLLKQNNKINSKFVFLVIIFGITSLIGYLIRPTIIIPVIAIFIISIIYIIQNYSKIKVLFIKNYKKIFITIILTALISLTCYKLINTNINKFATNNNIQFPIEHWIMMGLHGNGSVTDKDNNFTLRYNTTKEKKEANREEIRKTITDYGFSGLINHFIIKLPVTWSDGISSYSYRLGYINESSHLYQYIFGEKKDFIVTYSQAFRIVTIFLVVLNLVKQLNTSKLKKVDYNFLFTLILFGAILFYLIWESKNVYSFPFVQFMLLLSISQLDNISKYISTKIYKKQIKHIGFLLIILTIFSFISLEKSFTNKVSEWHDYQININMNFEKWIDNVSENNKVIKQEFYATKDFNRISLYAIKLKDNNTKYKIKITYDNKKIASFEVEYEDIKDEKILLNLENQEVIGKKKYSIEITPTKAGNKDSIMWGYRFSKATDQYEGTLKIDNKKISNDLLISVYNQYNSAYISKKKYYFLLLMVIIIEFIITKYLSKNVKN